MNDVITVLSMEMYTSFGVAKITGIYWYIYPGPTHTDSTCITNTHALTGTHRHVTTHTHTHTGNILFQNKSLIV